MPEHEDSLGGETFSGEDPQDPAEQSLGDGATMGGDTAAHSLGDQSTFGDANIDDELFDDGMEIVDLSTRYTEEGVLGKGGFGEVILATDTRLGRKVAIKRILGKAARSKNAVHRFLTEAKSIAALSHNNIVQIHDYGRSTDGPFLIMECVQGGSLLDLCRKGPIELEEAVNIFSQVCDGLAKAHAAGIIHRDIKPANVLMTEDGIPKLTDFGLAKDDTADTGMTMEGAVIGTLDFMPPEQRQGAEFTDHRSDLWSLAATFYQMLTGKSPKVINISSIPPKLQSVVAKALEQSKEDRFQSAMEMREAILQAHSGKMDTSRSLGEGECPQCATRNPPDRKFCRECSVKLQVSCLKCEQDMAIWDKGCGECGTQQQPLVKKKFNQLQKKHDAAEKFLQELKFEEAETSASAIATEEDSRLQNFKSWYEEFSQRLVDTRKTEHERLKELLEEAKTHEATCDYEAARSSLNKVDKRLKDHELEKLGSAKSIRARITTVLAKITKLSTANDTVKEQALSFLEEFEFDKATEAAREIETDDHPHLKEYNAWFDEFVKEVQDGREAVSQQRQTQLEIARDYLATYDYDAAISALDLIPTPVRVGDAETLREDCVNKRIELSALQKEIKDAVRMNVLSDLLYLLPKVQRAMELHVGSEELAALRNKLETRERERQKQTRKVFVDAEKLLNEGKARDADELLQRMPANIFDAGQVLRVNSISECANAEAHLVEVIGKVNEDGVVDSVELLQILDAVQDVISFAPSHRSALKVESELISRLKAAPEKYSPQIGALDLKNLDKIWAYFPSNYRPHLNYKTQTRLEEIRQRIFKLVGKEFKLDSPKQLRKILFADLGFPVLKKTASGEASTAGPVLRKLSARGDGELPGLIIRYREIVRLAITYKFASSHLDIVELPASTLIKLN